MPHPSGGYKRYQLRVWHTSPQKHNSWRPGAGYNPVNFLLLPALVCHPASAGSLSLAAHSVNAGRPLPIENINQVIGIPNEIHLQLSLLIDHEFGCRVQLARALALVRIIQVEFASRQVVVAGSRVPVHLTEPEGPVSDEANLPSSWGWNHLNVTAVIPQSARDLDVTRRFHLAQRVDQPFIPALLERLDQDLLVCLRRVIVNVQRDTELRSHLGACAHGSSINGLGLITGKTVSASYDEQTC